jgi:hypothetical protein
MTKKQDKGINNDFQGNLRHHFWRYFLLVVLFFNTAIPIYLLTHPGLLFYNHRDSYSSYFPNSETWNSIFGLIVANCVFIWIYRNNKLFNFTLILNVIYSLGLYLFPFYYFKYFYRGHSLTTGCLIFSVILTVLNIFVSYNYCKWLKAS